MRDHYARAEFAAAGDVYDAAVSSGAATSSDDDLLRARILLKHDENRAVAFLIGRPARGNDRERRGQWALLLAIGYSRMRDFERADDNFALAQRLLTAPSDKAQIAYHLARRWLLEGRVGEAWSCADEMTREKSVATKIANQMLRSFIYCHEERYRDSAEVLIDVLTLMNKHRQEHLEEWFHAVQNLALLGRELSFDRAATVARQEIDRDVEWPQDFNLQRFQALKAVGWTCALRGDMLGCFRYLRAAERVVPSKAFKAIISLDRAYFARIGGETHWCADEIAAAEALADEIDWNALQGEERIGLLLFAEATSTFALERSRYYLARYKNLDRMRSPLLLAAFDHRVEAMAAYTEGVVRLAARDDKAEHAFREAWVIFDRIGYDWRAARAALRLFDVTKKTRWRHLAEDKLEGLPQSWLARELTHARRTSEQIPVRLPPMQHKVFSLLCQKFTTAEIAQHLGLSEHTVRNHLKAVFRAYGVKNRAALVAEAANRGDLPALA